MGKMTTHFHIPWLNFLKNLSEIQVVGVLYAVFHSRPAYENCSPKILGTAWVSSYPDEIKSEMHNGNFLDNDFAIRYICETGKPIVWCDNSLIEKMTLAERARWENEDSGYFATGVSIPIFEKSDSVCGGFCLASSEPSEAFLKRWEQDQTAITKLVVNFDKAYRGAMAMEFFNLSTRELDMLAFAAAGLTSKEAAKLADLSPKTVESYLNAARVKTKSRNTTEAVAKAVFYKLI